MKLEIVINGILYDIDDDNDISCFLSIPVG